MKTGVRNLVLATVLLLSAGSQAWAVQTHGGAEGLVSHQIGHILFLVGMGYLLFRLYLLGERGPGWFEFRTFLWLVMVWNLLTFSAHWLDEYVDPLRFVQDDNGVFYFVAEGAADLVYYLSRLDHLILAPAMFFLLRALKKWSAQP